MPTKSSNQSYDVIIIGAGISGLVCGCFLAKAGMKVLICEQHYKPGGYCTSFKRQGFMFDAAAHSFGGYNNGPLGRIFRDLEIDKKITIQRFDPADIIITPDCKISFFTDLENTIQEFQKAFPREKSSIKNFYNFLFNPEPNSFAAIRSWTFKNLLDRHFKDDKLKTVISFPLYGNGGLPPSLMSAFIGSKILKEYLLDGGYYPGNNMQSLADKLSERFVEFGGELLFSSRVIRIAVKNAKVSGVVLEKGHSIKSRYVISNCDARQTFLKLLRKSVSGNEITQKIKNMIPSLSIFILYLGLKKSFRTQLVSGANLWNLSDYDLERTYLSATNGDVEDINNYMVRLSPDQKTILAFLNVAFRTEAFWKKNKQRVLELFIDKLRRDIMPDLLKHIAFKGAATPSTLCRYTSNYKGAAYGWACIPSQLADPDLIKPSFVQNLYLSGHWSTQGLGIPGVVYVGYDTAKKIARKEKCTIL